MRILNKLQTDHNRATISYAVMFIVSILLIGVSAGFVEGTWRIDTASDFNSGTFSNTEVGSLAGADYIKLASGSSSGTWSSPSHDWGETVVFKDIRTDSEISTGGIDITVEVSDDGFSSVKDSTTKTLSGGTETLDISSLANARYVRLDASLSSTNSDKELTTLHEVEVIVNATNICSVDNVDIDLRSPDGTTTGWFDSTFSSSSGTCGTDPDTTETWTNSSGYNYCPLEGSYDGRTNAYTESEEATDTFSWETSSWSSGIYTVDYDSSTDWCSCGDKYSGNSYSWIGSWTDAGDTSYPNCCENDQVAWYDFEEATGVVEYQGTTAHDRWNNNDGTLNNFDWTSSSGWTDSKGSNYTGESALQFDGSDDYVDVDNTVPATKSITISLWTKGGSSQPAQDSIIEAYDSNNNRVLNIHLPWDNENVYWDFGDDPYDRVSVDVSGFNWQTWNHWTFVADSSAPYMAIYRNGNELIKDTSVGKPLSSAVSQMAIGSYSDGGSRFYDGTIDEVRIYNKALSQAEIQEIYHRGVGEIWTNSGGTSSCVEGEEVTNGNVATSNNRFLVKNGEAYFCQKPGGEGQPYGWGSMYSRTECDFVNAGGTDWYCGAGGTDKAGEWHTLSNSGCQLVERIRGGRIIVH